MDVTEYKDFGWGIFVSIFAVKLTNTMSTNCKHEYAHIGFSCSEIEEHLTSEESVKEFFANLKGRSVGKTNNVRYYTYKI